MQDARQRANPLVAFLTLLLALLCWGVAEHFMANWQAFCSALFFGTNLFFALAVGAGLVALVSARSDERILLALSAVALLVAGSLHLAFLSSVVGHVTSLGKGHFHLVLMIVIATGMPLLFLGLAIFMPASQEEEAEPKTGSTLFFPRHGHSAPDAR